MIIPYSQNQEFLDSLKNRKIIRIFQVESQTSSDIKVWKGEFEDGFLFIICFSLNIVSVAINEREMFLDRDLRTVGVFNNLDNKTCSIMDILAFLRVSLDKLENCDIL